MNDCECLACMSSIVIVSVIFYFDGNAIGNEWYKLRSYPDPWSCAVIRVCFRRVFPPHPTQSKATYNQEQHKQLIFPITAAAILSCPPCLSTKARLYSGTPLQLLPSSADQTPLPTAHWHPPPPACSPQTLLYLGRIIHDDDIVESKEENRAVLTEIELDL